MKWREYVKHEATVGKAPASDVVECAELRPLVERKVESLRYYDVLNMDRALAICNWGRSGSLLLASYLDGHDHVVMLPTTCSGHIYSFFNSYPSLALRDKLLSYPHYSSDLLEGDFPIVPSEYEAAVSAILLVYGNLSSTLVETRRAFFQFLHVAYNLAIGRRPATPRPTMIYAQHHWDEGLARCFVEDFPKGRFAHTVRDPISAFDRTFEHFVQLNVDASGTLVRHFTRAGYPHPGMAACSRAIRFEDLHNRTVETACRLADWLEIPFSDSLLRSTFNGVPYVVQRSGVTWSGPRLEQALRVSTNISPKDRVLLFALFYEYFRAWNYPCPKVFNHVLVRVLTCFLLLPIPLKIEIIGARLMLRNHVIPNLRGGNYRRAIRALLRPLTWRLATMWYVSSEIYRTLFQAYSVLKLL
jgi:hypothetical protein